MGWLRQKRIFIKCIKIFIKKYKTKKEIMISSQKIASINPPHTTTSDLSDVIACIRDATDKEHYRDIKIPAKNTNKKNQKKKKKTPPKKTSKKKSPKRNKKNKVVIK